MKQTTISIDENTAEEMRKLCFKLNTTRVALIRKWIKEEKRGR